jgi:hypothetical protein
LSEEDSSMNILHITKKEPDASTKRIIEIHKAGNAVTIIDLSTGPESYDKLVAAVFASDRVFCW